jgi:DNA polymerase elongation subunit (family B)
MKVKQCLPFDPRILKLKLTPNQIKIYETYGATGSLVNETARRLDKDSSAISQSVRGLQLKGLKAGIGELDAGRAIPEVEQKELKVLFFDIEVSPIKAVVWNLQPKWIAENQVTEYGRILCFAAKWLGTEEIIYEETRTKNDKRVTRELIKLFDQADIVCGHNSQSFDVKWVTARALGHGINPPSPFKNADTYRIAKKEFKLPRNSLSFLAEYLKVSPKSKHSAFPGMVLWTETEKGNPEAWTEMKAYCIQDVETQEQVYYKLRAWDSNKQTNFSIFRDDTIPCCPQCGSVDLRKAQDILTGTQLYDGYRCLNCHSWARGRTTLQSKERSRKVLTKA